MVTYNKLVRDNIPAFLASQNIVHSTRIASSEEYEALILQKLKEEMEDRSRDIKPAGR